MLPPGHVLNALAENLSSLGRIAEVEDLVGVYHFLASDQSKYITGHTLIVDGGRLAGFRTDVLKRLSERAKRVIWLNPEARPSWGTGDSDMLRYAPYCTLVTQCNTLARLERIVAELLGARE